MKKMLWLVLLCPLLVLAQNAPSPVVTSDRVWVKDGHAAAFKKALTDHVKTFHTGPWKWRVYEVLSGPDAGAYQINEGPNSWSVLEGRGDLSAQHTKHYETAVLPHISKSAPTMFATYDDKLSTTQAANWSNKVVLTHFYTKPGRGLAWTKALQANKPVWEKLGRNVAVWRSWSSGPGQVVLAGRLKDGFKDFDNDTRSYSTTFDEVNGAGSYEKYLEEMARSVDHIVGEMIEFKPELSSPK